jgi:diguanylate cyclase (GGDEF)-like protein
MKLVLVALGLAAIGGILGGGRLSNLARLRLSWGPLAMIGLVLQVINPPGRWPLALLLLSFVLLTVFALKNIRTAGFVLILVGVLLNFAVIAANAGMPVSAEAIVASGQQDTLGELLQRNLPKHHLASAGDRLLFLADVIAIPPPIAQAISVGDIFTFGGVAWVIVAASRRRPDDDEGGVEAGSGEASSPDRPPRAPIQASPIPTWAPDGSFRSIGAGIAAYVRGLFEPRVPPGSFRRGPALKVYEAAISLPVVAIVAYGLVTDAGPFVDWGVLVWILAIAVVDLLPVPTSGRFEFSLSFPLELSAAVLYADPAVAGLIALLGSFDRRELSRELPPSMALFIRAQIALAVMGESIAFHSIGDLESPWYLVALGVTVATVVGYSINTLLVAFYTRLQTGRSLPAILHEMHVGVFGEFVLAYMGLALFSVMVSIATKTLGLWAILVFVAPLAFARQMFQRTHSLQEATTELEAKQAENEYQATHDALTGLPNRTLFHLRLVDAIERASERGGQMAVMLMDLDQFKEINDTLGHHFGDMLLKELGPRLANVLRGEDLMARLGGDEFGILLPDVSSPQVAVGIAQRIMEELEEPIAVEGLALDVAGSIGIAMYPAQAHDAESLMRRADVAMYAAKETQAGYEIYHEELDRNSPHRLTLVSQVRAGIEGREFVLHYQPKVRLRDGRVAGAEALVRWEHPDLGLLMPDEFIPLVEKTVLLRPLTHYVVRLAFEHWAEWAAQGVELPIAVNLSPRSLLDLQLPVFIRDELLARDIPAEFLRMELTEGSLMADSARSSGVLTDLARAGVSISIDDFGTGYSSLSYLRRLPIDEIKIDRSFVMNMKRDANDFMIVRATVELGQNLGLRVVAEGVEDLETFDKLAEFGCDEAQGFYIGRPMPVEEFTRWLTVRHADVATPTDRRLRLA